MKKLYLLLPLLFLFACTNHKSSPELFTPDILAQQLFSIDPSKDTSLETIHGTVIRISSGSFNVTGNIQVEVKEAFTPAEILASGMTTESNGRPLRSGGMIYINATAKGGAIIELIKPIKVSVPNQYYDSAMQVFKGVETDSAGINWVDPIQVDSTPQSKNWLEGKTLFRSKCTPCHRLFKDVTGPMLANLENRGPWSDRKNIYDYIRNTYVFMNTNIYVRNLKNQYGSVMTSFQMPNEEIDAILDYIKNETKRPGAVEEERNYNDSISRNQKEYYPADTADMSDFNSSVNKPCGDDTFYIPVPKQNQSFFEDTIAVPFPADTSNSLLNEPRYLDDPKERTNSFTDSNPTNGMYDFEIKTFGWYNIDAYVEGYVGTTVVKLWAQVQIEFDMDMHVYLFCPDKQILSVGYEKQGDKYFFDKINGGVPLFLNDRAVLFAFGSQGDKMYYGISEFTIKAEQTIPVKIKETTDEEIRQALLEKQMDGIDLGIEKKEKVIRKNPCDEPVPKSDSTVKKQEQ